MERSRLAWRSRSSRATTESISDAHHRLNSGSAEYWKRCTRRKDRDKPYRWCWRWLYRFGFRLARRRPKPRPLIMPATWACRIRNPRPRTLRPRPTGAARVCTLPQLHLRTSFLMGYCVIRIVAPWGSNPSAGSPLSRMAIGTQPLALRWLRPEYPHHQLACSTRTSQLPDPLPVLCSTSKLISESRSTAENTFLARSWFVS
jgi:hypothetical protein